MWHTMFPPGLAPAVSWILLQIVSVIDLENLNGKQLHLHFCVIEVKKAFAHTKTRNSTQRNKAKDRIFLCKPNSGYNSTPSAYYESSNLKKRQYYYDHITAGIPLSTRQRSQLPHIYRTIMSSKDSLPLQSATPPSRLPLEICRRRHLLLATLFTGCLGGCTTRWTVCICVGVARCTRLGTSGEGSLASVVAGLGL